MRRPRLTIKLMMIAIAVIAVLLFLYRTSGRVLSLALIVFMAAICCWVLTRRHRRWAAWCFGVSAAVGNASVAALCIYLLNLGGVLFMSLVYVVTFPLMLGAGSAWAVNETRSAANRRSSFAAWIIVLTLAVSPPVMLFTLWPLRLAFLVSRPAMDRLADRVAAGRAPNRPEWAGLYLVKNTAIDTRTGSGSVGLIIDPNRGGRSGFVRLRPGNTTNRYGPLFNFNFDEHMVGRWWYQNED